MKKIRVRTPDGIRVVNEVPGYLDLEKAEVLLPDGRRLTDAVVDEIVAKVHARMAGRPSLTAPGTRSPEVKARVPQATKDRLDAVAAKRGTTASVIVREALDAYLKSA